MTLVYSCGDVTDSPKSNQYKQAIAARKARKQAERKAYAQRANLTHTKEGDFTHLAPTGNLNQMIRR